MLVKDINAFYSQNDVKPINTLFGHNAELLNVKACGTYSNHCALTFIAHALRPTHSSANCA
jgi:hypothetical protein